MYGPSGSFLSEPSIPGKPGAVKHKNRTIFPKFLFFRPFSLACFRVGRHFSLAGRLLRACHQAAGVIKWKQARLRRGKPVSGGQPAEQKPSKGAKKAAMKKHAWNRSVDEKLRANELAYTDAACPVCGQRLALCLSPELSGLFPLLNLDGEPSKTAYYCPNCQTYLKTGGPYPPYLPQPRPAFAGDGKRYYFAKAFVNGRILRTLLIQALAALLILFPFLAMVRAALRDFTLLNWAGALLCGVLLFVTAFFMSYYFRMWKVGRRSYFELGDQGLIFCDGLAVHYMPWADFRLAAAVPQPEGPDIYTFDTANRSVVFNSNLQDYQDIALRIARRLRDSDVPMNLHLLQMLY